MSLAFFPMYPSDFDADTGHLTFAEDGAYNRLLRLSWRCVGAKMPDDLEWIFRKARAASDADRALVAAVLSEFFTRKGGKIFSKRLAAEWVKAHDAHERRILSGSAGGKAKALKTKDAKPSNALAMPKQPEPQPEPYKKEEIDKSISSANVKISPVRFDEFWAAYPHRGGVKKARKPSEAKYLATVKAGIPEQTLIDAASRYAGDRRVLEGYARDPTTWLNQAGWQDEIETPKFNQITGGHHDKPSRSAISLAAFVGGARGSS